MGGGGGGVVVAGVLAIGISHCLSVIICFFTKGVSSVSLRLKKAVKLFSKRYDVSFVEGRRRLKSQSGRLSKQAQFLIGLTLAPPAVTLTNFAPFH